MISVSHLSFSYNLHQVLEDANFTISNGAKVALVGPNGAGKSTLLKIISGRQEYDVGKIEVVGSIGWVPQEVSVDPDLDSAATIRAYINPHETKRDDELQRLMANMEMDQLSLEMAPRDLSGGQKTKLAFIRNLVLEPDILLLDEPTNFLDVAGTRWVMQFLSKYPKTLIIISHDIALLDQSVTKTLNINTHTKKVEEYTGNYSQYQRLHRERQQLEARQRAVQEQHIKRMTASLSKLKGKTSEKGVRQRVIMQRRIERAKDQLPATPPSLKVLRFTLPDPANVGRIALQVTNAGKSFDKRKIFQHVNFIIERGQRVALIGQNGAGKTTLIKLLVGDLEPDTGTIHRHELLDIGYYSQEHELFDLSQNLFDTVLAQVPSFTDQEIRSLLGRFMFPGDRIYQTVGSLSGGEKTRLAIALLTIKGHNLLILDEPTTYLDVMSQRVILEVLKDYRGALLVVSHTKEFIQELQPDRALLLPDNKFDFYSDDFLDRVTEM